MFYRIFVHCVSPRQYVLYVESFIKTTIFKEVESVSVYHATCPLPDAMTKTPNTLLRANKQTRSTKSKSIRTSRFLYFHGLSLKLAKKEWQWLFQKS